MKALDSFTVERLEELGAGAMFFTGDEVAALARIALAAKRAEPDYHIVRRLFTDGYGTHIELDVYIEKLDASKSKDDHGGEIIPVYTTPQLNSPEIPEGWKLVPIEPTRQMMSQGHFSMGGTDRGKFMRIYQAMLAAAPEPQNQQQNIPEIIPQGWTSSDPANAALVMLDRIDTMDSADDDRIEDIKLIIRQLAAAPEKENG
ncbi:TPA: hypothetical protein ACW96C_004424 [Yersinia enterocolitica]